MARTKCLGIFNSAGVTFLDCVKPRNARDKVAELQPDRGEVYLAKGYYQYYSIKTTIPRSRHSRKRDSFRPATAIFSGFGLHLAAQKRMALSLK